MSEVTPVAASDESAQETSAAINEPRVIPQSFVHRLLLEARQSGSTIAILIVVLVASSIWVPGFLTVVNFKGLALSVSMTGMVACTMLFCLAAGYFDLSVEAVVAASGVICAVLITSTGNVLLGMAAGLLAGALVGLVNGLVIAKLRINALITTLATMQIVRGLGYIVSDGKAIGITQESFFVLGNSALMGVPVPVLITFICFIVFAVVLNKTAFGKNTLAIGGNQEAARLAGIPVERLQISIFLIQGLIAGFAGIILASRMTSGQPKTSEGFALEVISACVLGGVSLSGGVGTMSGVLVGVLIMGIAQNTMNLLNISPFYQYVVRGVILLLAVVLDTYRRHFADGLRRAAKRT